MTVTAQPDGRNGIGNASERLVESVPKSTTDATSNNEESGLASNSELHGFKLYLVLVGVCFGAFVIALDVYVIGTAIPSITSEFHNTSHISWYPAAYTLAVCSLTPLAGKMATVFSLRWVYQGFFFVFLVGSAICGWASTSKIFIVGRAISGIGAAAITSGGLTIVLVISSPQRRPLYIGLCSSCFALGLILAPVIGGAFTEKVTWRWCFWINLPGGAITLLAMFFFFKVPSREDGLRSTMQRIRSLDIVGSVLFVPGIFMLILALQWGGNAHAWKSATIIGLLVGSVAILGLFAVWESRLGDSAIIPGVLVARRTVLLSVIFSFCHLGALSVSSYYLPEWFQAVQGATPFESGIRVLPSVISQIVGTISAGAIALKIRYYNPWFYIGPVLMCTAAALYSQFTVSNTPSSQWIGYQVIQGLGVGFSMQMPSLMVQLALKDRANLLPIGVSLNIFAQFLGATVTQVIAGAVFHERLESQLASRAALSPDQIQLLYQSGIANVRSVVDQYFPLLFNPIMEAYNSAIAQTHFVAVASAGVAFFLAFGIEWIKIEGSLVKLGNEDSLEAANLNSAEKSSEATVH
ncbi:aspyridones efflux protein [Colletotrichum liriopes]|uniref:Aspyridones efflux protein n=1 Tax=Colletotrichum liriopes TaxID=708192 RepID=A0AA37LYA2_9PEZI|nr:aspyridones efflux protein [Colletotrichum liriopes]